VELLIRLNMAAEPGREEARRSGAALAAGV
jgi:hypothetical protein